MFGLEKILVFLYFLFGIFPSLSILTVDVGVPYSIRLFHVIGVLLGVLILIDRDLRTRSVAFLKENPAIVLLFVLSILVALFAGLAFENMPIMAQRIGADEQVTQKSPLKLGLSQLAHISYLALGIMYILSATVVVEKKSDLSFGRIYKYLGVIVIAFSSWQFLSNEFSLFYPNRILFSNIRLGHIQSSSHDSVFGTFSEPSLLAAYLTGYIGLLYSLVFFNVSKPKEMFLLTVAALLVIFLTQSMTAAAGLLIICSLFIVMVLTRSINTDLRKLSASLFVFVLILLFSCLAFFYIMPEAVPVLIKQKLAGGSLSVRSYADLYGLSVLSRSHYLGVGLGVNATNSLLVYVLSSLGVVGLGLFVYLFIKPFLVIQRREGNASAIFAVLPVVLMVAIMSISIPNLDYPPLWMSLAWAYFLAKNGA